MLITGPPGIDPTQLRNTMEGRVSAPGDPDWDAARQAWNLAVDQRPAAVAIPASVADGVAIVAFARDRGLLVTAQGTGHNAGAYDTLANTILVKTHELRGVEIDVDDEAIDALVAIAGPGSNSPLVAAELRQLRTTRACAA